MEAKRIETKDGRLIGVLKGSVLHKRARSSAHLFRKVGDRGAWGLDLDVLTSLPERGSVYVQDLDTGTLYMSRVAQWKEHGSILHFKDGTADHYTQCFLPIEFFDKTKA